MIATKELEDEVKLANRLEATNSKLEEQYLSVVAKKEEMEKHSKTVNEERKAHINSLKCEIQKLDDNIVILDKDIASIMRTQAKKSKVSG